MVLGCGDSVEMPTKKPADAPPKPLISDKKVPAGNLEVSFLDIVPEWIF